MLAESAEAAHRGAAFGFRQAMDSAGAVVGPLAAFLLLRWQFDLRTIFALAALPGAVCIFLVLAVVRETGTGRGPTPHSALRIPHSEALRIPHSALPQSFRRLLLAVGIFAIGNSSDLFLVLRAQGLGLGSYAPLLGLVFNVTYTLLAWPFGRLSDRLPRKSLLAAGYVVFAGVYAAFAWVHSAWHVWLLFALYGGYYALTEGVMKAMVADAVEPESRGRAYGILAAVYGALVLAASLITGQLWQRFGPALPFTVSALLALIAAATVLAVPAPQKKQGSMPVSERPALP
jgi:MFS family permease